MRPEINTLRNKYLCKISGGVMILTFLVLTFFEYERILSPFPNFITEGRYIDYSILLYLSRWIIYFLLFLAGIFTFFESTKANLFLLIFSLTALLEIYFNEAFYIVKSISGYPKYVLFGISIISLVYVAFYSFRAKKLYYSEVFLSIVLAITIVYLPNALITFYF